jgi:tetratricopeptide (TPR) repeat protein
MAAFLSPRWRLVGCAFAALVAAGCAPSSRTLRKQIARGAAGRYIGCVPFVRQRRNWCGPAALASVVRYYGIFLSQEEIAREVYLPSIGGSLTIDLQRCAQKHGLWCHAGQGSVSEVCTWLDRGVPVIALLRQNWIVTRTNHYVVVTGYHARRRYFIAHTGHASNRSISFRRFARQHKAGGGWLLAGALPQLVQWPLTADGHNDLGLLLERQGKPHEARDEYERAIAVNPDKAIYHFNLGNVLARLGSFSGARGAYRRAIRLEPDFAAAHNNHAHILLKLGVRHAGEARRAAARAVELGGPRIAYYHDTLGRSLLDLRRPRDAVEAFRAALKAAGDDTQMADEARLGLILALDRAGLKHEAIAAKKALLERTSDPAVRLRAQKLLQ